MTDIGAICDLGRRLTERNLYWLGHPLASDSLLLSTGTSGITDNVQCKLGVGVPAK